MKDEGGRMKKTVTGKCKGQNTFAGFLCSSASANLMPAIGRLLRRSTQRSQRERKDAKNCVDEDRSGPEFTSAGYLGHSP